MPTPITNNGMQIVQKSMSGLASARQAVSPPSQAQPMKISHRASTRLDRLAAIGEKITESTPPHITTNPAQVVVYPMLYWSHSGVSTFRPKKPPKANASTNMLAEKPRWRNTRRSTMGCDSVNSQITKEMNPITAIAPRTQISGEENQSLSLPSSSMIWSAATQVNSSRTPILSTGFLTTGSS